MRLRRVKPPHQSPDGDSFSTLKGAKPFGSVTRNLELTALVACLYEITAQDGILPKAFPLMGARSRACKRTKSLPLDGEGAVRRMRCTRRKALSFSRIIEFRKRKHQPLSLRLPPTTAMVSHGRSASLSASFCSLFDPRFRLAASRTASARLRAPLAQGSQDRERKHD